MAMLGWLLCGLVVDVVLGMQIFNGLPSHN